MGYALKRGKGKAIARKIRHQRVRKHVFGTPERPRLAVFRPTVTWLPRLSTTLLATP